MREQIQCLKATGSFPSLDEAALLAVARSGMFKEVRKNKAVFYQGDCAETLYLVLEGEVKKTQYRANDSTLFLGRKGKGSWLGLAEVVARGPYCSDALTETAAVLFSLQREVLHGLLGLPGLLKDLLRQLSRDVYFLHGCLDCDAPLDKILNFLLQLPRENGDTVSITQESLAEAVGYTRETVNRHMQILQRQGVLALSRGRVRICSLR